MTGFLGSGKTTLLLRMLEEYRERGLQPAVIMNELGEANLDGEMIGEGAPMAELLGGCACCTVRGDLGLAIKSLAEQYRPDVLIIEATGAANPLELMDGVADSSMYVRTALRSVIAVADGPELLRRRRAGQSRTFRLMREQIRCASRLVLNKTDRLDPEELVEAQQLLREWNPHAPIVATVRAMADLAWLTGGDPAALPGEDTAVLRPEGTSLANAQHRRDAPDGCGPSCGPACGHLHEDKPHTHESHDHEHEHDHEHAHESHAHVSALTHYFRGAVDSHAFEALLRSLPPDVYRAKGIVEFRDTNSRFLFQYAFRETDFMRITPQGTVHNVAVFIGEGFDREALRARLHSLESHS